MVSVEITDDGIAAQSLHAAGPDPHPLTNRNIAVRYSVVDKHSRSSRIHNDSTSHGRRRRLALVAENDVSVGLVTFYVLLSTQESRSRHTLTRAVRGHSSAIYVSSIDQISRGLAESSGRRHRYGRTPHVERRNVAFQSVTVESNSPVNSVRSRARIGARRTQAASDVGDLTSPSDRNSPCAVKHERTD